MATEVEYLPEQTAASRVNDILSDVQQLIKLQLQLTRWEIEQEIRQRIAAAATLAFGLGVLILAPMVLCLSVVHLLHWAASPPGTDPAWLPLWGCHAAVAMVLVAIGGTLAWLGQARLRTVKLFFWWPRATKR